MQLKLYLIEILHQTTTRCFELLQPYLLYLIEILHQTTTNLHLMLISRSCILSKFYIKPQLLMLTGKNSLSCILSKFYIKPQPGTSSEITMAVVSYRNSTSNHNVVLFPLVRLPVVSYRNSTSNHNFRRSTSRSPVLYLIEILHQTTTVLLTFFAVR